jgi:hypothetical protein
MTQLLLQDSSPWLVGNWLSYDWPVYLAFLLGLLMLAVSWWPRRSPPHGTISVLAMRSLGDDPPNPRPSCRL